MNSFFKKAILLMFLITMSTHALSAQTSFLEYVIKSEKEFDRNILNKIINDYICKTLNISEEDLASAYNYSYLHGVSAAEKFTTSAQKDAAFEAKYSQIIGTWLNFRFKPNAAEISGSIVNFKANGTAKYSDLTISTERIENTELKIYKHIPLYNITLKNAYLNANYKSESWKRSVVPQDIVKYNQLSARLKKEADWSLRMRGNNNYLISKSLGEVYFVGKDLIITYASIYIRESVARKLIDMAITETAEEPAKKAAEEAAKDAAEDAAEDAAVAHIAARMAEFPGGKSALFDWLNENVKYPDYAAMENIHGKVVVKFTIEKDGSIGEATIINSVHESLDKECLRVVKKMPKWIPGVSNGKRVRSYFNLPINF